MREPFEATAPPLACCVCYDPFGERIPGLGMVTDGSCVEEIRHGRHHPLRLPFGGELMIGWRDLVIPERGAGPKHMLPHRRFADAVHRRHLGR